LLLEVLKALDALLRAGEPPPGSGGVNSHLTLLDEAGGIDKIEALQEHEHANVFERASALLEAWFGTADEEVEDVLTAPVATSDGFRFGL
jgi:hypothetical protein